MSLARILFACYPSGGSPSGGDGYIIFAHATSPYVSAYEWTYSGGFGSKFSNPSSLPPNTCNAVTFSPSGAAVVLAHSTSPYVTAYEWDGSGFGTKYSDPALTPAGIGWDCRFTHAGDALVVVGATLPYVRGWPWDDSTGFGSAFSSPASAISNNTQFAVRFTANDSKILFGGTKGTGTYTYISHYEFSSSSGFGTRRSGNSPTGYVRGLAIANNSDYWVGGCVTSQYLYGGRVLSTSTPIDYSATGMPGIGYSLDFSSDDSYVAVGSGTTPYAVAYPWGPGFGTKVANPSSLPSNQSQGTSFAPDDSVVAFTSLSSPRCAVYDWSSGFGSNMLTHLASRRAAHTASTFSFHN